jgi:hypothetical protein
MTASRLPPRSGNPPYLPPRALVELLFFSALSPLFPRSYYGYYLLNKRTREGDMLTVSRGQHRS